MTIPNIITVARLLIVPIVILMIVRERWAPAFALFVAAGISDGIDGYIARRFDMQSRFGAYVDPLADKVLLVAIYVALALGGHIPAWLAGLVVARDGLILAAILLSWGLGRPVEIRPLIVSKLNTAAQIGYAALVLAAGAFGLRAEGLEAAAAPVVAALTVASAGAYLVGWLRHMRAEGA